jgi:hypothetical protein
MGFKFGNGADRALKWFRENKVIALIIAFISGIAFLVELGEKIEKVLHPFLQARSDANEIANIRRDVEGQRNTIHAIARDANAARKEIAQVSELAKATKSEADQVVATGREIQELAEKANASVKTIQQTSDFAFVLARVTGDDRGAFDARDYTAFADPFVPQQGVGLYDEEWPHATLHEIPFVSKTEVKIGEDL